MQPHGRSLFQLSLSAAPHTYGKRKEPVNVTSSLKNFYHSAKRAVGEAVVGDDYRRADGTVDGILLGAAAGAAVGGTVGAAKGLYDQFADTVDEKWETHGIQDPKLNGHRYFVRADWDTDCYGTGEHRHCDRDLDGWWHTYSPRIENRIVGNFQKPVLHHSHNGTFLAGAATGAALGAGVGAAVGLLTGFASRAIGGHPMSREPLPPQVREQLVEKTGETVVKSTAIGAGLGAALGLTAGLVEVSKNQNIQRTWNQPLSQSKYLGDIPRNHYEWNRGWGNWNRPSDYSRYSPSGERAVYRQAPLLDDAGRPAMESVTRNLSSQRFGPVGGLVGGAAIGAGLGFATGVASSIVNRLLLP